MGQILLQFFFLAESVFTRCQIRCLSLSLQVMWNAAVHAEYLHDHSDYGFDIGSVHFSWEWVAIPGDSLTFFGGGGVCVWVCGVCVCWGGRGISIHFIASQALMSFVSPKLPSSLRICTWHSSVKVIIWDKIRVAAYNIRSGMGKPDRPGQSTVPVWI